MPPPTPNDELLWRLERERTARPEVRDCGRATGARDHRREGFDTDPAVLAAVKAAAPAMKRGLVEPLPNARADIRLEVDAAGRVRTVSIDARPTLSRTNRRVIEQALRAVPFPPRNERYVTEFPIILQGAH